MNLKVLFLLHQAESENSQWDKMPTLLLMEPGALDIEVLYTVHLQTCTQTCTQKNIKA
jgi:hypothetical protein